VRRSPRTSTAITDAVSGSARVTTETVVARMAPRLAKKRLYATAVETAPR